MNIFGIVPEIVWDVVQRKVPELLEQVKEILAAEDRDAP